MRLIAALVLALTTSVLAQPTSLDEELARPVLASGQTRVDTQVWLASKVPVLHVPTDRAAWERESARLRARILDEVVYRGTAREWRAQTIAAAAASAPATSAQSAKPGIAPRAVPTTVARSESAPPPGQTPPNPQYKCNAAIAIRTAIRIAPDALTLSAQA